MKLKIRIERDNTIQNIVFLGKNLGQLLEQLKINSQTILVVKKGIVLTEDEELCENDELEILSVISGG